MTNENWTAILHSKMSEEIGDSTFIPFFALHAVKSTKGTTINAFNRFPWLQLTYWDIWFRLAITFVYGKLRLSLHMSQMAH